MGFELYFGTLKKLNIHVWAAKFWISIFQIEIYSAKWQISYDLIFIQYNMKSLFSYCDNRFMIMLSERG